MAFQTAATATPISAARGASNNEQWKSDAFINLYLPTRDGGKRKLGAIGLKLNRPSEGALIEWLKEDPSRIESVLGKLEMDFQMASGSEGSAFDL